MPNPLHIGRDWPQIEIDMGLARQAFHPSENPERYQTIGQSYSFSNLLTIAQVLNDAHRSRSNKYLLNGHEATAVPTANQSDFLSPYPPVIRDCIGYYLEQNAAHELHKALLPILMSQELLTRQPFSSAEFDFNTDTNTLSITYKSAPGEIAHIDDPENPLYTNDGTSGVFVHNIVYKIDSGHRDKLKFVSSNAHFAVNPENTALVKFFYKHCIWDQLVSSPKSKAEIARIQNLGTAQLINVPLRQAARKSAGFLTLFSLAYAGAGAAIALGITGGWGLVPALLGAAIGFGYSLLFTPALVLAKQKDLEMDKAAEVARYSPTKATLPPQSARGLKHRSGAGHSAPPQRRANRQARSRYSDRQGPRG